MAKNIKVTLQLDTKNFDRGIVKAKGSMDNFDRSSRQAKLGLGSLSAGLIGVVAGVASVTKGFNLLNKSLQTASRFEDVGVTLKNIVGSAEGGAAALNVIREVAKDLPIAFEELAGAAPGLATVSGNIGELEDNIRKTADIAATFGIPFEVAAGQLQRAFSAGAGAADVFREKGVLAAAGFQAGVSYSVDETIAKLDEFSEKIQGASADLNKTFSGAVNQAGDVVTDFQAALGDAFKPEITAALQKLTQAFRDNEKEALELAKTIGRNVLNGFIKVGRMVAMAIDLFLKLTAPVKVLNDALVGMGTNLPIVATAIYVVVKAQQAFRTASLAAANAFIFLQGVTGVGLVKVGAGIAAAAATTAALTVAFDKASEAIQGTDEEVGGVTGTFNNFVDIVLEGGEEIRNDLEKTSQTAQQVGKDLEIGLTAQGFFEKMAGQVNDLGNSLFRLLGSTKQIDLQLLDDPEIAKRLEDYGTNIDQVKDKISAFTLAQSVIKVAFEDIIVTSEELNATIRFITQNFEKLGLSAKQAAELIAILQDKFKDQEALRNFINTLEGAAKTLSTDLATAFLEGQNAGDSFRKFFKTLVTQIIADVFRLAIIQPILGAILGPFGFGFGSGGSIIRLPGKANGGTVMQNKPYVVGEKGPELFVPGRTGTIVPNSSMGGGGTVINIQAVDTQSFQQALARDPEFIYNVSRAGARRTPA